GREGGGAERRRRLQAFPRARKTNIDTTNMADAERWLSLLVGGGLAAYGLSRGTLTGLGLAVLGGGLLYRGATGRSLLYEALGVRTSGRHSPQAVIPAGQGVKGENTVTILKPREGLFNYWRNLPDLPRFMPHLEAVTVTGPNLFHWVAKGPVGARVEWDAEIYTERRPELIAWRSLEGSTVDTAGSVHFTPAPGDRGTEVRVVL